MSENTLQTEIFDNNDNYPLEGKREWQVITSTIDIHSYSPWSTANDKIKRTADFKRYDSKFICIVT